MFWVMFDRCEVMWVLCECRMISVRVMLKVLFWLRLSRIV